MVFECDAVGTATTHACLADKIVMQCPVAECDVDQTETNHGYQKSNVQAYLWAVSVVFVSYVLRQPRLSRYIPQEQQHAIPRPTL